MTQDSYSKIDQPVPFKADEIVMSMVGNKLRYGHLQTNGICICTYLDGELKGKAWYGIPSQLTYWNEKVCKQLQKLTQDIEVAEANTQALYSQRGKVWQLTRIK
jgi:hypothetical protein